MSEVKQEYKGAASKVNINCPCEPQRGIRGVGLSGREIQHPHGILDLWKKTKRIAPDVPEVKS